MPSVRTAFACERNPPGRGQISACQKQHGESMETQDRASPTTVRTAGHLCALCARLSATEGFDEARRAMSSLVAVLQWTCISQVGSYSHQDPVAHYARETKTFQLWARTRTAAASCKLHD